MRKLHFEIRSEFDENNFQDDVFDDAEYDAYMALMGRSEVEREWFDSMGLMGYMGRLKGGTYFFDLIEDISTDEEDIEIRIVKGEEVRVAHTGDIDLYYTQDFEEFVNELKKQDKCREDRLYKLLEEIAEDKDLVAHLLTM